MTDIVERLKAVDHLSVEDCFTQSPLFSQAAEEITRLRQLLSEAEAALDEREIASGLTSNGNLWRFWAETAKDMLLKLSEAEKREREAKRIAANAEAYGYGHGVAAAVDVAEAEYKRHCTGSGFDSHPARSTAHCILEALKALQSEER